MFRAIATTIVVFALVLSDGLLGLRVHVKVSDEHESGNARAVVAQALGVVGMLLFVALGILVGQSYA